MVRVKKQKLSTKSSSWSDTRALPTKSTCRCTPPQGSTCSHQSLKHSKSSLVMKLLKCSTRPILNSHLNRKNSTWARHRRNNTLSQETRDPKKSKLCESATTPQGTTKEQMRAYAAPQVVNILSQSISMQTSAPIARPSEMDIYRSKIQIRALVSTTSATMRRVWARA